MLLTKDLSLSVGEKFPDMSVRHTLAKVFQINRTVTVTTTTRNT